MQPLIFRPHPRAPTVDGGNSPPLPENSANHRQVRAISGAGFWIFENQKGKANWFLSRNLDIDYLPKCSRAVPTLR